MLAALYSSTARAEAGPPPCLDASFVEVFAGAPDCPGVRYAVIDVHNLSFLDAEVAYVMLGSDVDDGVLVSLEAWALQPEEPQTLLIGTANVAEYFGVEPDVVVDPFPLRPTSGWMDSCTYKEYGEEASLRINTCDGEAIRWISDNTVELVSPSPRNSKGEVGQWAGCPALNNDAGAVDASLNLLCDQIIPEPPPVIDEPDPDPVTDPDPTLDDDATTSDEPVTDDLTDGSSDDDPDTAGSSDDTSSTETETGSSSDDPEPSTEDDDPEPNTEDDDATSPVSPTGEQGDDEPNDSQRDASTAQPHDPAVRDAGPTQGEPVQHGIESGDASGCDCSVVKTRTSGAIWGSLLVGLFAIYGIRRGSGRRVQGR